jgi:hypothetical protein
VKLCWNDTDGRPKYSDKSLFKYHFVHLTWTGPWLNRGTHGDSPITNRPSCVVTLFAEILFFPLSPNIRKAVTFFKVPRLLPRLDEVNEESGRWEQSDKTHLCPCNYLFPSNITLVRIPSSKAWYSSILCFFCYREIIGRKSKRTKIVINYHQHN